MAIDYVTTVLSGVCFSKMAYLDVMNITATEWTSCAITVATMKNRVKDQQLEAVREMEMHYRAVEKSLRYSMFRKSLRITLLNIT